VPTIILETFINAPADVCFDLTRDARVHINSVITADGEIALGQRVTFEGRHFGRRQKFTVEVIECERPRVFVDEMRQGAFSSFRHVHEFSELDGGSLMKDTVIWTSPVGIFGRLADKLFIEGYLRRLVATRNMKLKEIAEAAN